MKTINLYVRKFSARGRDCYSYSTRSPKTGEYFEVHFRKSAGDPPTSTCKIDVPDDAIAIHVGKVKHYTDKAGERKERVYNEMWIYEFTVNGEVDITSDDVSEHF